MDSSILQGFEGEEFSQEKGLPSESVEEGMVRKMSRLSKRSLFQHR
ncbi:MAG: hypothetical protein ACE5IT_09560 [bacterium]